MPSLLVFNPNTNAELTQELLASARAHLPDVTCRGMTAATGVPYIASADALAVARNVGIEALTPVAVEGSDAVILACFGDPGLRDVRATLGTPVFGMAECAFAAGARRGRRFAVVTGGQDWPPLIRDLAAVGGYGERLVDVKAIASFGEAAREEPEATLAALRMEVHAIVSQYGPVPIVLGGTGLASMHRALAASVAVPVLCSWRETLNAVSKWMSL